MSAWWKKLLRPIAALAVAGGGATAAYASLYPPPPPPPAPAEEIPVPALRVAGHALPKDGDSIGSALDLVRKYAAGEVKLRLPDGRTVSFNRADFGLEIDRVRIAEFVKEAQRPGSPIARAHASSGHASEPLDVPLPLRIEGERAVQKLVDLKAEIDSAAVDAAIDLEARKVKPEKLGYRLDVYGTLARLEAGFRRGETTVDADVAEVAPKRLAAQLGDVKFDAVLGYFETRYNTAKKFADRTYNLRLAASRLDGMVLMPGEVFDFNGVVGPRDEAHGYRVAPVIAQGELVDGIGGGTCQISGTLHAAAFFGGLDIVERSPHSRPSSYIKLGLDATVAYPNINFRFRNPFDFPVVLHEKVAGGVVRAEVLGPSRRLTVSYFRRIDEILPFEEIERESEKLPKGERVVVQRGTPGFVATASRLVRDGAYGERTRWSEKYPPVNQIVAVGSGPDDLKPAVKEDAHPEYVADEYLVITQGPPTRASDPNSGMNESRVPGKTGEPGWIKKLGLEKTPLSTDKKEEGAEGDKKDDEKGDKKKDDEKGDKKKDDGAKKKNGDKDDKKKKSDKKKSNPESDPPKKKKKEAKK